MPANKRQKRSENIIATPRYLDEVEAFFRERVESHHNSVSYQTLSSEALQNCLELGFCNGDVKSLLRTCRDANNENLDEEEIDEMVEALHEDGTTINQPFCFAPGAVAIKQMLVSKRLVRHDSIEYYTHDIEVGIYASKNVKKKGIENDFAEWHWDENLNYTIQLTGKKEWKTAMGEANPLASGMNLTAPRNAYEKNRNRSRVLRQRQFKKDERENKYDLSPNEDDIESVTLHPGMMIRVSPGEWHRVEACETGQDEVSISINIRLAHIAPARWTAECIFSGFTSVLHGYGSCGVVHRQLIHDSKSKSEMSFDRHLNFCASPEFIADAKRKCPLLRILPFDSKISNGLILGNTLSTLLAYTETASIKEIVTPVLSKEGRAFILANRLCAIEITEFSEIGSEEKGFENAKCMKISSTSTLTNFDYMNTFYIVLDDEGVSEELVRLFADEKYADDEGVEVDQEAVSEKCARFFDVLVDHGILVVLADFGADDAV